MITGGSGLLALSWAVEMSDDWDVVLALHNRRIAPGFARTTPLDLLDFDACRKTLAQLQPDMVVNAAGLTNVETCEQKPELATKVNVNAARNIALSCAEQAVPFVCISTDHLFDGTLRFAPEDAPSTALNVYAQTKADGERAVIRANPKALVARTNFYCWGPSYRKSFAESIVSSLRNGETISLFDDVFYTPIYTADLVGLVHELVARDAAGIFNLCGPERLRKLEFGYKVAAAFGLDPDLIRPAKLALRKDLIRRPLDMSLSDAKLRATLGRGAGSCDESLKQMAAVENDALVKELSRL